LLPLVAVGCASAGSRPEADVEATLARGGGISGVTETIHVWSSGASAAGEWRRSDSRRSRAVHLSTAELSRLLADLDSLAGAIPPAAPDTGRFRIICGDAVTTDLAVRRGRELRVAHEACPHGGAPFDAYWSRVNSLFDLLASAAR
jgi:hypothetical protein